MDTAHPQDPHFPTGAGVLGRLGRAASPLILDASRPPAYENADDLIADALRGAGRDAPSLEGGLEGWRSAGFVTTKKHGAPGPPAAPGRPSRWIMRERPKIDRIARARLSRRVVDPSAQFLPVPAEQVLAKAQRTGAIAYDVPDVRFPHRGAEGLHRRLDAPYAWARSARGEAHNADLFRKP